MKNKAYIYYLLLAIVLLSCSNNNKEPYYSRKNIAQTDTSITNSFPIKDIDTVNTEAVLVFSDDGDINYIAGDAKNIYRKTKSGLEYKFIRSGKTNTYPRIGDIIYFDMTYSTPSDSIIFWTSKVNKNFNMRIEPLSHSGGCIEEAFLMLREGDSAVFKIDAYNFFKITQGKAGVPNYIKLGDKLTFRIKMNKIVNKDEHIKQNLNTYEYYINQENSLIERFALELKYPRKLTKSGINIFTISEGNGNHPTNGQTVSIHYTAGFIDGSVFDSTLERNEAFNFTLGKNEVILGLEEAIKQMTIGEHSIIIIPFKFAYGDEKHGIIPPFSTLVFEIEILYAK